MTIFGFCRTFLLAVCLFSFASAVSAQSTSFTYQGKLTDGGLPANGTYDITFKLYDSLAVGTQISSDLVKEDVSVSDGIFTVSLDFGSSPFTSNNGNYLDISVRPGASGGAFTQLAPRQPITSSPYAVQTIRATSADTAANFTGSLGGDVIGGQTSTVVTRIQNRTLASTAPSNGQVLTWNNGVSQWEPGNPVIGPGSPSYIQNTTSPQAASNFNISGNGTAGGTLSGNNVNADTQINIAGNRFLSSNGLFHGVFIGEGTGSSGNLNTFVGFSSGQATTSGGNAFFGAGTGTNNTFGSQNSFFGLNSGNSNVAGNFNAFFGAAAGSSNTSGRNNTFYGTAAGGTNAIGRYNTLVGSAADVGVDDLAFAAAIGANAVVSTSDTIVLGKAAGNYGVPLVPRPADTVQIPGSLVVTGSITGSGSGLSSINASNISSGILSIANGGTGSSSQNFVDLSTTQASIGGTKQFTGSFNISDTGSFNVRTNIGQPNNSRFAVSTNGKVLINLPPTTATDGQLTVNGTVGLQLDTVLEPAGGSTAVCQNNFGLLAGCSQTYVNQSSDQTIGGNKTFSSLVRSPGGIFIANPNTLIITSPNGACWGITVSNAGLVSAFPATCP